MIDRARAGLPRVVEVLLAGGGLLVAVPVLLLAGVAIAASSSGGILFRQCRIGRGGRPFTLYKLRTMHGGRKGPGVTVRDDPRVTPIGRLLRKLKADELPALWNVVRGEMALVGPRPEVPQYVDAAEPLWQRALCVRPGLTDPVTIRLRNEEDLLAAMELECESFYRHTLQPFKLRGYVYYLENRSWLSDLVVLWRSLRVVLVPNSVATPTLEEITGATALGADAGGRRPLSPLEAVVSRLRRVVIWGFHVALAGVSLYTAFWLRFDGQIPSDAMAVFRATVPGVLVIRGLLFVPFRLYEGLWRYTGILDLRNILACVLLGSGAFFGWVSVWSGLTGFPRSVFLIDALLMTCVAGGVRLTYRLYRELGPAAEGRRVLVYGAGDAGEAIVRDMKRDAAGAYAPIGFLDDDPGKLGQTIHGVRVLGGRNELPRAMVEQRPDEVLITMPGARPEAYRAVLRALEPFKVPITTLPNLRDLLGRTVSTSQIRGLAIEDLLHRASINLDDTPVRRLITGKRIIVTGAGGSIGSELCRQIARLGPESMVLLERYENSLHQVFNELRDGELPDGTQVYCVIGDVSDEGRVREVMAEHRPQIVFHAAAHKHVPLMETNACEAVKNNVSGTRVLAEAAVRVGVERFVLVSSDKAVNPSSIMGASKRVAELMLQTAPVKQGSTFFAVRFGNVLGSNGSVVPRFIEQVNRGGPVTVTDPEMTRYFMLISEAVQLVLHAAADGEAGSIYVLEMGEPVRLIDLARDVIRLSGFEPEQIPIEYVGLRPGEKLNEELVGTDERPAPSSVANVLRVLPTRLPDPSELRDQIENLEQAARREDVPGVLAQLGTLFPALRAVQEKGAEGGGMLSRQPPAPRVVPAPPEAEPEAVGACEAEVVDSSTEAVFETITRALAKVALSETGAVGKKTSGGGLLCQACGEHQLHRSHARSRTEQARKRFTVKRLYRCHGCGWRGWMTVVESAPVQRAPRSVEEQSLRFDAIDAVVQAGAPRLRRAARSATVTEVP